MHIFQPTFESSRITRTAKEPCNLSYTIETLTMDDHEETMDFLKTYFFKVRISKHDIKSNVYNFKCHL